MKNRRCGETMTLHFSLKDIFGLCVVLMIWNLVMPAGTIWTAAAYFGAVLAYLQRRRRVAAEDGTSAADGFSTEGGNRRGGCVFRSGAGVSAADGILAAAFLFNLWYVLGSWGNVRQYDYYNFVMHTDYFLQNGFFLAARRHICSRFISNRRCGGWFRRRLQSSVCGLARAGKRRLTACALSACSA